MRGLKFILFIALIAIFAASSNAQQKSLYSQYMFNYFLINPAAAGVSGTTSINLTGREQWVGFPGAPKTHSVSAETRVLKNSYIAKALNLRKKFSKKSASGRIGVGIHFYNDFSGVLSRTGMQIAYGYHIPIRQNLLSFGVSVEPYQFNVNKSEILKSNIDQDDPTINALKPRYVVDGNFGMQYTAPLWYAGASITDLFQSNIYFGSSSSAGYQIIRHYFFSGGYKIIVNRMIMIEPTALMKFTERGSFQMDLSARAFYREDYWGGLAYRTGAEGGVAIIMAGLKYQRYYFGYAFDYTLSPIMSNTYGSHEFMLTVKFGENARRYRFLNRY
jgi:type IX secretion system PorP/SprF family membrane protein